MAQKKIDALFALPTCENVRKSLPILVFDSATPGVAFFLVNARGVFLLETAVFGDPIEFRASQLRPEHWLTPGS